MGQVEEFFDALFKGSVGYLGAAYAKNGDFKNRVYKLPNLEPFYKDISDACSKGYDCYFVPSVLGGPRRNKASYKESRVVWVDFDTPTETGQVPTGEFEPSVVVSSSPGKYHMYWLLDSPEGPFPVEGANKFLIQELGGDKSGFDCTQLLRVPGTLNYKYDPPNSVEIVKFDSTIKYPIKNFPGPFLFG